MTRKGVKKDFVMNLNQEKKRKYVETIDTYVYSVSLGVSGLFLSS